MSVNPSMFSSKNPSWETPQYVFQSLNEEFDFDLDVCALPHNAKCKRYITPEMDTFKTSWFGDAWMNPPYGRPISDFIKKAYEYGQSGGRAVCLIPARTCTKWWHDYVMKASEIRLVKNRIRFVGAPNDAPFPSAVVVFELSSNPLPKVFTTSFNKPKGVIV